MPAAIDVHRIRRHEIWSAQAVTPQNMQALARPRVLRPQVRMTAVPPAGQGGRAGGILRLLLDAARPPDDGSTSVLRPLWAEEAMHRAYSSLRLVEARNRAHDPARRNPIATGIEEALARDLVSHIRALEGGPERKMQPCSQIVRDASVDLVALFGAAAHITLATSIERVTLPAYKRRALVLATLELVTNALLHAFNGRRAGRIELTLTAFSQTHACLTVADDGVGCNARLPDLHCGVAAGLAELLEADLAYDLTAFGTTARIWFPVRDSWP